MLWWMSFALDKKGGNLGLAIAEGATFEEAVEKCNEHKCNPGGEILGIPLSPFDQMPEEVAEWTRNQKLFTLFQLKDLPAFLQPMKLSEFEKKVGEIETKEWVCKECNDEPNKTSNNTSYKYVN